MASELYIAFKLDRSSVAAEEMKSSSSRGNKIYYICCRDSLNPTYAERLYPFTSFLIGLTGFILNRVIVRKRQRQRHDRLFSLVSYNPFLRYLVVRSIALKKCELVNVHWVGYGFLPYAEIPRIADITRVIIHHHDWRYFTGGCHVPSECSEFTRSCNGCRFEAPKPMSTAQHTNISHRFVSEFQKNLVGHYLSRSSSYVQDNMAATSVVLTNPEAVFRQRLTLSAIFIVLLVGVRNGNGDNKGSSILTPLATRLSQHGNAILITVYSDAESAAYMRFQSMDKSDLAALYASVDLVVVPSKLETFSMVSKEAILNRTPVVVRRHLAPSYFGSSLIIESKSTTDNDLIDEVISSLSLKRSNL